MEQPKPCPRCQGNKDINRVDIKNARNVRETCPDCKGSGIDRSTIKEGLFIVPSPATVWKIMYQVKNNKGELVPVVGILFTAMPVVNGSDKFLYSEIIKLETFTKDKKKTNEYLGKCINGMKRMQGMKYIVCAWNGIDEDDRELLKKCGFFRKEKEDTLMWNKDKELKTL